MAKNTLLLLAVATTLLIVGAGCDSLPTTWPTTVPTASPSNPSLTPSTSPVIVTPTTSYDRDMTQHLVAAETDATWKLYANKALGYSVNTPTRGKYTPTWEMKYVDQSDPHIINGCYYYPLFPTFNNEPGNNNSSLLDGAVTLDGTKFCRTRSDHGGGGTIVIDDYTTALGKKFIVVEFTKHIVDASVVGCAGKMTEAYSLSETACIPFVASDYQATLDGIMGTFKMHTLLAATTSSKDLEKSIISKYEEYFRGYSDMDMVGGYPLVFTNTTDPAVRFTSLTESGGDAANLTSYFVNQAKQKILQIDAEVFGGDFGQSGNLTISLNGGSTAVIQREQDVNYDKREITYKGLRVNKKLVLPFNNLVWKPTSILEFTVLGVSSDLTSTYFSDGLKQYSYNIVSNELQEINELPALMAKPIK